MDRAWKTWAAVLVAILACPVLVGAQGLGDAASREKQKRAKQAKPAAKTFTDEDLAKEKQKAAAEAGEDDTAKAADTAKTPGQARPSAGETKEEAPSDPVERERRERSLLQAEWRMRFANAREQLRLAEAASWHEVVRTELRNGVFVPMKIREQVETPELLRARQALADLEERFRRTGLPAGWARE